MSQGYLCVGGPYDRKMHAYAENRFDVHQMRKVPPPNVATVTEIGDTVAADRTTYYKVKLCYGRYIWLHESLTIEMATDLFLRAYKEHK